MNHYRIPTSAAETLTERPGFALCARFGRTVMIQALKGFGWSNPKPEVSE